MICRWAKLAGAVLLACTLGLSSAYAQTQTMDAPQTAGPRAPTVEYIVVVLLLALPVALVCRSSRR